MGIVICHSFQTASPFDGSIYACLKTDLDRFGEKGWAFPCMFIMVNV